MRQNKGISLIKLVIIIVAIIVAILLLILIIYKVRQNLVKEKVQDNLTSNLSESEKEDEIINKIKSAFNKLRNEVIINVATVNEYQPSYSYVDTDNTVKGTAFDLKNIIISELGENVIDESKDKISEIALETFKNNERESLDLTDGYHVYLSNGEDENEKFITIVYKDSMFCHGMAYYDTENNLVSDKTGGTFPVLVAQIKLTVDDASFYLEPIKSIF